MSVAGALLIAFAVASGPTAWIPAEHGLGGDGHRDGGVDRLADGLHGLAMAQMHAGLLDDAIATGLRIVELDANDAFAHVLVLQKSRACSRCRLADGLYCRSNFVRQTLRKFGIILASGKAFNKLSHQDHIDLSLFAPINSVEFL